MAQYYVSPTGSDSTGTGAIGAPWLTIGKGDTGFIGPGDTVNVAPGTYTAAIANTTAGTVGARITYLSTVPGGAKIAVPGTNNFPWFSQGDYTTIQGFEVVGAAGNISGIHIGGNYTWALGNHVHDIAGVCSSAFGHGVIDALLTATGVIAAGNRVHNNGGWPVLCDYNHGIYLAGPSSFMYNNLCYNNAGYGLTTNHAAHDTVIANNTAFGNSKSGISFNTVIAEGGGYNFLAVNNISINNGLYGINVQTEADNASNHFFNNCLWNNHINQAFSVNDSGATTPLGTYAANITVDPKIANYQADGSGNYRLSPSSPCIGAGSSTGAPLTDFDGNVRPQAGGYDIGAYQFSPMFSRFMAHV